MTGFIHRLFPDGQPAWARPMAKGFYYRQRENLRFRGLIMLKRQDPESFALAEAAAEAELRALEVAMGPDWYKVLLRRGTKMRRLEARGLLLVRAEQQAIRRRRAA